MTVKMVELPTFTLADIDLGNNHLNIYLCFF